MHTNHSLRNGTSFLALAALMIILLTQLAGCSEDSNTPESNINTAPILPDSQQLVFDFGFFESAQGLEKSDGEYDHFLNAYLRSVVLDVMAHLVLAAPVQAFSAAVHTVPVADPDGTWVWTYLWTHGSLEATVVLRGLPAGDVVEWELSLIPQGYEQEVLWFFGTSSENGEEGQWSFHDLDDPAYPISGEISWGVQGEGHFLNFLSHDEGQEGDQLRFIDQDPNFSIEFTLGDGGESSFIRWNASGSGSLRVPDYNEGIEACWDEYQMNTLCP